MKTERPSVYIETSVVSYLVSRPSRDPVIRGHQIVTREWWTTKLPEVRALISAAVALEASRGNADEAMKRKAVLDPLEVLEGGSHIEELAAAYLSRRLIPESSAYDAIHLAYASHHAVDYLLTWNCRHLASAAVRRRVAAINAELGCATPTLCTPEELMEF